MDLGAMIGDVSRSALSVPNLTTPSVPIAPMGLFCQPTLRRLYRLGILLCPKRWFPV
jgi:hypothetical protein